MADQPTDQAEATPPPPERPRTPVHWGRLLALLVLSGAAGFLIYQNLEEVAVRAFWWEFKVPLVVVVVATALLTLVVEVLVRTVAGWRRRHPTPDAPPSRRRRQPRARRRRYWG